MHRRTCSGVRTTHRNSAYSAARRHTTIVLKKSVLVGMRPRANNQNNGQIDDNAASNAIARSSRVRRTLRASPRIARTPTPASTAAVRKNWSASLGRSSGINLPRSMPPMNGWVARKT
jgi:hypothetical protein